MSKQAALGGNFTLKGSSLTVNRMGYGAMRLLEIFPLELVRTAAADVQQWQAISFDAVKHLLLCRLEQKPPRLDLENYPHLPTAQVP